jgi:hypothetical protein
MTIAYCSIPFFLFIVPILSVTHKLRRVCCVERGMITHSPSCVMLTQTRDGGLVLDWRTGAPFHLYIRGAVAGGRNVPPPSTEDSSSSSSTAQLLLQRLKVANNNTVSSLRRSSLGKSSTWKPLFPGQKEKLQKIWQKHKWTNKLQLLLYAFGNFVGNGPISSYPHQIARFSLPFCYSFFSLVSGRCLSLLVDFRGGGQTFQLI